MKKKLLVLLITVASTMMSNLASAIHIDTGGICVAFWDGAVHYC
jgi:hypothetical protein